MSSHPSFSGNGDATSDEKSKEEEGKKPQRVPLLKLFAFADAYDYALMVFGSIGACIHGASVPVFFIFFGKLINIIGLAYLFPAEASHKVAKYSLDFVYLSVVILFSSWTEVACWMHTGERQAGKMRMAYLRSMLNQDISLFDTEASTGEVISAITSDIIVVQDAISEKVGNFMHYISRFITGFAIGFIRVWQISLVTLSIVPLIAIAGGVYAYIGTGLIASIRKSYVKAGEIAEEVIGNVRTVQAFAGEERAVKSYTTALMKTYNYGRKAGLAKGLGLGTLHCVLFLSWSLLVWFTSIVVHKGIANGGDSFTTMLNVVIAGLIKYSRELSRTTTRSQGASFRSDRESMSRNDFEGAEKIKAPRVSSRRLYSMISPEWTYGVSGTICALIAGAQMPLFALGVTQALVSYYMDWDTTRHEVRKIAFLFIGGAFVTVLVHGTAHTCFGIIGERLTLRVRERMFSAILRNEIGWFDNTNNTSSMLASRLESDARLLQTVVVDRSTILLQNIGLVVTSFIIAFILNWRLTLVVMATYPLIISGHISEKLFMKGYGVDLDKAYLKANMLAGEAVSNIRTVAAFCSEEKVLDLYARELVEPSKSSFNRGQTAGILYGVSQFFIFSAYGLALWYGSVLMGKGLSGFKSVMKSFMVLIVTALAMGETLAMAPDLLKGNQMVASVFEILDRRTEVEGDVGEELTRVDGTVDLRGVQFSYPSRPDVLIFKDFDLRVRAGKSMALVGQSGSGKSSVLALILRFYDPVAGKVMVDGKDIKRLKLKSLRKHIGLVQQEPALFGTSIYENILYGKEGASEGEVIEAAKLANAHSFISALPEGYSTKVGERGVQLSGGQKQRVAIARAILKNPAILLLDEATSALDVESERVVQQALDRLMKNRTTIVVAHRLSTIKNADQISVLQDGKIVEHGTHSSLIENRDGAYFKLISLQQQQQQHQR
ncbi:hypothetical protein RJ639_000703 [Escallonia herrerae]|uniref:ABC transporter B family member 2-like n=1 Tax=Escallonia herrerae TaxID=1293975 RepID=A0AA88XBN7_9ASTE|nr:hypothetical protein RJ639_000703 [Escallonia herrerae]